jgi:hypothetical protein
MKKEDSETSCLKTSKTTVNVGTKLMTSVARVDAQCGQHAEHTARNCSVVT